MYLFRIKKKKRKKLMGHSNFNFLLVLNYFKFSKKLTSESVRFLSI